MADQWNRHHRKCRSKGGKRFANGYRNLMRVPVAKHRSWHCLFENLSAHEICAIINEVWLNPEWKFICVKRKRGTRRDRKIQSRKGKKNGGNPPCNIG